MVKRDTPVRTGKLRNSIHIEDTADGFDIVAGDDDVDYAIYVHNGTSRQSAQPFIMRNIGEIGAVIFEAYCKINI